jgi:IclR family transcriptional regulator, acetate operon repressor
MRARTGGETATALKVVDKAVRVLRLFDVVRPEWAVSEIASELSMPISTAHRITQALESHAFLMRAGSRYRLGMAAIDLYRSAAPEVRLPAELRPAMQNLFRATGETTLLTVFEPERHGALCVDRIEAAHSLRLAITVGRFVPVNGGASAKALVAFLSSDEIDYILSLPLPPVGPRSITDPDALRRELATTRRRRLAFSYEETNVGTWGLSAPVLSSSGQLVAAIGIAAPTARYSAATRRELSQVVKTAASEASKLLDGAEESPAT